VWDGTTLSMKRSEPIGCGETVLLENGLATLGSDGRLRLTDAGRQAEHEEWLDGWG
jgi:hypothetical protein